MRSEGCKINSYQSDGAGELISSKIITLLAENSAKMIYSPAYVAKLNSDIERNHRTIFESAHAMLIAGCDYFLVLCRYLCSTYIQFPTYPNMAL